MRTIMWGRIESSLCSGPSFTRRSWMQCIWYSIARTSYKFNTLKSFFIWWISSDVISQLALAACKMHMKRSWIILSYWVNMLITFICLIEHLQHHQIWFEFLTRQNVLPRNFSGFIAWKPLERSDRALQTTSSSRVISSRKGLWIFMGSLIIPS